MAEEKITADEIIIKMVRENKLIYDKTDGNYKNADRKKDVWAMISSHLKEIYNVDMSAENVEKRWTALRDMFGREERRKKLRRSRSGSNKCTEWHLYQSLLFLSSHIAHRKTKLRLIRKSNEGLNSQSVTFQKVDPLVQCEATLEEGTSREMWNPPQINHAHNEPQIIDNDAQPRPQSKTIPSSSCSSNLSQFSKSTTNPRILTSYMKPTLIKMVPPMNDFASQNQLKSAQVDERIVKAITVISNAMTTMSTLIASTTNKDNKKDGYMPAIEEGLKHVPGKSRTQCIIEVLQVIQKYEIRE